MSFGSFPILTPFRIAASNIAGAFQKAMDGHQQTIAKAATTAMRITTEKARDGVRANIASAGFSKKWQNATQSKVFPENGYSVKTAGIVYNKIPYSNVFDIGELIKGKPLLLVPLPVLQGTKLNTPAKFMLATQWPLVPIIAPGHPPMLGAEVRMTGREISKASITLKKLRGKLRRGPGGKRGTLEVIPVFVGIEQAQEKKLFNAEQIIKSEADKIGAHYESSIKK